MKSHRLARINAVIREVASETILFAIKDPRVKMVTVTRAEVAADLQHAKVYVSILGTESQQKLAMHGLRSAAGFIQSRLGDRIKTRYTPVIHFVDDPGIKNSLEITRLINEALANGKPLTDEEAIVLQQSELDSDADLEEDNDFEEDFEDEDDLDDASTIEPKVVTDESKSVGKQPPQTGAADGPADHTAV